MKKIFLAAALLLSATLNVLLLSEDVCKGAQTESLTLQTSVPDSDWNTFIRALAWVESRWDDNAESPKQAVGYLQVTPILVADANRIAGREAFTLEGRRSREESVRLFNVIMEEYNPQHDLHLALKLWNPYSKVSYHRAVIKKYNELKNI